jgi:hypothetical protein
MVDTVSMMDRVSDDLRERSRPPWWVLALGAAVVVAVLALAVAAVAGLDHGPGMH